MANQIKKGKRIMRKIIVLIFLTVCFQSVAREYDAYVIDVVDGDTFTVNIHVGLGVWLHNKRLRILDINAPEIRTKDLKEKERGIISKNYLKLYIEKRTVILDINEIKPTDNFGRYLATVYTFLEGQRIDVGELMLKKKHAVVYKKKK